MCWYINLKDGERKCVFREKKRESEKKKEKVRENRRVK